jgi:hypothetical protein
MKFKNLYLLEKLYNALKVVVWRNGKSKYFFDCDEILLIKDKVKRK